MNIETTEVQKGERRKRLENCPIEKETRQFKDANIFANFVILHVKFFEIEWLIESKMKVSCVKKN